ncbi:MAG: hypothetical protein D6820_16430, partial [Lentisphaerae bacterium]
DISHLLAGGSGEVRSIAVTECPWSKSVRQGPWRYVYYPKAMFAQEYPDGFGELYNLEEDPWEENNLYFDPQYADIIAEMRSELLEWLITTTRPATILPAVKDGNLRQGSIHFRNYTNADGKIHPDKIREASGRLQQNYL